MVYKTLSKIKTKPYIYYFFKKVKLSLIVLGILFLIVNILALTTLPFWAHYKLGKGIKNHEGTPELIILFGGAGMPSKSNLIRLYYTSTVAKKFNNAPIVICLPGETNDSVSAISLMKSELVLHNISEDRILFENSGHNTREQAINLMETYGNDYKNKIVGIITSPAHMRRSILCLKKVGFEKIQSYPAFEAEINFNLLFEDENLGGNKIIPGIGENLQLRYQYWNHLKYIITVTREYTALIYYKLKGWI